MKKCKKVPYIVYWQNLFKVYFAQKIKYLFCQKIPQRGLFPYKLFLLCHRKSVHLKKLLQHQRCPEIFIKNKKVSAHFTFEKV